MLMKKNIVMALLIVTLAAGGAFAQMSAGGGLYLASDFGGGVEKMFGGTITQKFPYVGGGVYGFFEPLSFVEINVGFFYGGGKWTQITSVGGISNTTEQDATYSALDIGVMGKYPIAVGDALSVYPALGITFRSFTTAEVGDKTYDAEEMSAFWLSLGGGLDFSFGEKLYLRANVMYGVRLSSELEDDLVKTLGGNTLLGHGLGVKVGLGYRF